MLYVDYGKIIQIKIIRIIGIIIGIFLGLISLGLLSENEFLTGIVFGIITFFLVCSCIVSLNTISRFNRIKYFLENEIYSTEEMSSKLGVKKEEVIDDINFFLEKEIIRNVYYDEKNDMIVIYNLNSGKRNEKINTKFIITNCPNCGGPIEKGSSYCEYCGRKI